MIPVHWGLYSGTFVTCNAEKGCAKWHSGSIVQVLCNLRYDFQVIAGPLQWPQITYRIANASNQGVFRVQIIQCMYNSRQGLLWRGGAGEGASEDPLVCR